MPQKYDIFISYRRTAYDTANLITEKLRHAGYSVFLDIDTLNGGKFNEQLLKVIAECKDFVVILPANALDRCSDEEDWIRREVCCALQHSKNIIPVMLDGFSWPKQMPQGMEELSGYQAVTYVQHEYFDMSVRRLMGYLKSRPSIPIRKWLSIAAIVLVCLMAVVAVGFVVVRHVTETTCSQITIKQANIMGAVDMLGDIRNEIQNNSKSFFEAIDKAESDSSISAAENGFGKFLSKVSKETAACKKTFAPPQFELSSTQSYVLAYYDIKQEELNGFSVYYSTLYDDMDDILDEARLMLESHDYSEESRNVLNLHLECMKHSINAFYYGYLSMLSLFPKEARSSHYELSRKWRNYPNGTPLDLSQEEYEQFQTTEMNLYQEAIDNYNIQTKY